VQRRQTNYHKGPQNTAQVKQMLNSTTTAVSKQQRQLQLQTYGQMQNLYYEAKLPQV